MIILGILFVLIICIIIYLCWDTNSIARKEYEICSKKIPESFDGYKIVFVSDLHFRKAKKEIADRAIEKINKENADTVILGGDYIYRNIFDYKKEKQNGGVKKTHGMEETVKIAWNKISKIEAKEYKFAVFGNHDYWEKKSCTLEGMKKAGVKSLDNKAYWLNRGKDRIRVGGTADISEGMSDITKTTDAVNDEFTILVCHSPIILTLPGKDTKKVDLMLSGHFHGGQFAFRNYYSVFKHKRWMDKELSGLLKIKNLKLVLSRGVGNSLIPVRIGARPDYVVVTLRSKK